MDGPTRGRRRAAHEPDEPGALLARVLVARRWATSLPRVPQRCNVTVSFSDAASDARYRSALQRRGYRVVGAQQGGGDAPPYADLLVEQEFARTHPAWWQQVRTRSVKVYNLRFGPAQAVLADVLRLHLGQPAR